MVKMILVCKNLTQAKKEEALKNVKKLLADGFLVINRASESFDVIPVQPSEKEKVVFKVGTPDYPLNNAEINAFYDELKQAEKENRPAIVGCDVQVEYLSI